MNDNEKQQRFNARAVTSITTGISFIGLALTGVVLFFIPPGRIINWSGWTYMGLSKQQWGGLHIWFAILFIIVGLIHIYFNWNCLLSYFKDKARQHFALRKEWVVAFVIVGMICLGTVRGIAPFSTFLNWQASIKHGYNSNPAPAPLPHAELLTPRELAEKVEGIDYETMLANLKSQGIELDSPDQTLGALAESHDMTPQEIYKLATGDAGGAGRGPGGYRGGRGEYPSQTPDEPGTGHPSGGRGFGQLTLNEYCEQANMKLSTAQELLKKAGIEASGSMTLRDIANNANVHPSEIRQLLE
jgi:hypothetical protein